MGVWNTSDVAYSLHLHLSIVSHYSRLLAHEPVLHGRASSRSSAFQLCYAKAHCISYFKFYDLKSLRGINRAWFCSGLSKNWVLRYNDYNPSQLCSWGQWRTISQIRRVYTLPGMFSNLENSSVWDCELETGWSFNRKKLLRYKIISNTSGQKWKIFFCVYVFVKESKILCLTDLRIMTFVSSCLFALENAISS